MTRSMWTSPPTVYEVTSPSSHSAIRTIAMVYNIPVPLLFFVRRSVHLICSSSATGIIRPSSTRGKLRHPGNTQMETPQRIFRNRGTGQEMIWRGDVVERQGRSQLRNLPADEHRIRCSRRSNRLPGHVDLLQMIECLKTRCPASLQPGTC